MGPSLYWDFGPTIGTDNMSRPITVWAAYVDQYDIFYSVYSGSWSPRQPVHALDPGFDVKPALIQDTLGQLWVNWESRRDVDLNIYAAYYNGSIWSSPQQVTSSNNDEKSPIMLIDTTGTLWTFYCRQYADRSEIWGCYHDGAQWVESGPISGTHEMAYHPAAAVFGDGRIFVVWQTGEFGNLDLYSSYYEGGGWSIPCQITNNPDGDLFPALVADAGGVLWLVYQSKVSEDWEICAQNFVDSTWSVPEFISNSPGADINPKIVCSPDNELWVCWQSYAPGNWEIVVSHQPGTGIAKEGVGFRKPILTAVPSVFCGHLIITTPEPNQQIRIYDSKGTLTQTLNSADNRRVSWMPEGVSSGVYFVVVGQGSKYITRKVLFVK